MPNIPILSGLGMIGLAANADLSDGDRATVSAIANAIGRSAWVPTETQTDTMTTISGSDLVYAFYFTEMMQQAAWELRLSAEDGRILAVETFTGAATLVGQPTEPVEVLRECVTSKDGTTYAAPTPMEGTDIKATLIRTVYTATARGREMEGEPGWD